MDLVTLAKAKKYTDDSIEGISGVLKGKNCTIKSIEKIDGVNTITFQWTADDGIVKTSTMQVADGIAGVGTDGKSAYQVWLDIGNTGTEEDFLNSLNGFSPTITPNPDNTDKNYRLDITTKDGTFTTPNLRGGDEVTKYTYIGTGNLAGETYYSYEDLSTKIGETVEVTVSNRYGESQNTLTIISKISDTELEVDNGAWIETIMLTNVETTTTELINDNITSTTSTWSSTKIKDEFDKIPSDTPNTAYIINCVVISETDGNAEVVSYDGDFIKIQQTIADGGKVELRTNFNSSNYILEPSCVEEDYVSFNTVNKNANITIKVTEYGINDISYIDLTSGGEGGGGHIELTQAEYDALSDDEKMDGREYRTYDTGHIYKLGVEYGKDACFTSLEQLGLTAPTTVGEVFMAMPEKSMLMLNVEALVDDGTNVLTVTDMPAEYGVLTIDKWSKSQRQGAAPILAPEMASSTKL